MAQPIKKGSMWLARHLGALQPCPEAAPATYGPAILPESFEMPNLPVPRRDGPAFSSIFRRPWSAVPYGWFCPCRGRSTVVSGRPASHRDVPASGAELFSFKDRKSSPRAAQGRADGGGSIILRVGPDL